MHFDDGENPWLQTENYIKIFDWDFFKSASDRNVMSFVMVVLSSCLSVLVIFN